MDTRWIFICYVLLPLSASQSCPDEYKCSSENSTPPDIQSSFGNDTHTLDLSCKRIKLLDYVSKEVTNVTSVYLNDNCIENMVPDVFEPLVALRHLYLQNNQISKIHATIFQSNTHLTTLDLSGNKLQILHSLTFDKNSNLLWVNITGNPLNASAVEPEIFNLSLNIIDTCNNTENSINYFQAIPYLRGLNLTENAVFTIKNLRSYKNIEGEEISLENYMLHNLPESDYNDSTELRYDRMQKVIFGPSNASFMCFCNRLSAWFWCFDRPFLCHGHSYDTYSLLNCNVTPTRTSLFHTSSSSSAPVVSTAPLVTTEPVVSTAPVVSTEPSADIATTDDTTNFATSTNSPNKDPEQKTADNNTIVYAAIGGGIIAFIAIVVFIWIIVVRWRKQQQVREQRVKYTPVSRNICDPSSATSEHSPFDRRLNGPPSPIYATPHAHTQFTTFRPPANSNA